MEKKIISGLILLIMGLWMIVPLGLGYLNGVSWDAFTQFWVAIIPIFLAFSGLLLIWMEFEKTRGPKPLPIKR